MARQAPFRPFVLTMENGDRITIGHPENGSSDFYVIAGRIRHFGTFAAVTSVATADSVEHLARSPPFEGSCTEDAMNRQRRSSVSIHLVPTLCVGMPSWTLQRQSASADHAGRSTAFPRGPWNDQYLLKVVLASARAMRKRWRGVKLRAEARPGDEVFRRYARIQPSRAKGSSRAPHLPGWIPRIGLARLGAGGSPNARTHRSRGIENETALVSSHGSPCLHRTAIS